MDFWLKLILFSFTFCIVLTSGVEVDPSIIERLKSLSIRLRHVESKSDEVSQRLISIRSSSHHEYSRDTKNNKTKVQNVDFMNNSQLTLPSIYNYMSHLLGSKNSLVPAYHLSAGRHAGMVLYILLFISHFYCLYCLV